MTIDELGDFEKSMQDKKKKKKVADESSSLMINEEDSSFDALLELAQNDFANLSDDEKPLPTRKKVNEDVIENLKKKERKMLNLDK